MSSIMASPPMNSQKKKATTPALWNAVLELEQTLTDDEVDDLMDSLAAYGVSPGGGPNNRTTVTLTLPAENIAQAFTTALALIGHAGTRYTVVGVELLPTDEFDARSGLEPIPALLSVSEAAELLGLTKVRVNQMITEGKFTTARKVGQSFVLAYREVANLAGIRDPLDR